MSRSRRRSRSGTPCGSPALAVRVWLTLVLAVYGCGGDEGGAPASGAAPATATDGGRVDTAREGGAGSASATATVADTPDGTAAAGGAAVPPDTTGTVLPDAEEVVPERIPPAAYDACKQAAAAKLTPPDGAIWGKAPDTVERTPDGDYALVAQVRPDTLQPGISYACVVRSEGGAWRVITLEAKPAASP
ncbi:MAG TPA: hypothetical protein VIC56_03290 [Gemmatimonadota bacterium]